MAEHLNQGASESITSPHLDPPPVPVRALAPVAGQERVRVLDVLRGFALFGIFMVNMQFFAMPFGMAMFGEPRFPGDETIELIIRCVFEYKFISLFSLLFGMGLVVQMVRARAAGRPFVPIYLRRAFVLLLIGCVHAFALWYGDILLIYSLIGLWMLLLARLDARGLLVAAGVILAIGMTLSLGFGSLQVFSQQMQREHMAAVEQVPTETNASLPDGAWESMMEAQFDPFKESWQAAEMRAYQQGPFLDALLFRTVSYAMAFVSAFFSYGWHVLAMFCVGAAFMKLAFHDPHWVRWHMGIALSALLFALPCEAFMAYQLQHAGGFTWAVALLSPVRELTSTHICLGYFSAGCLIVNCGFAGALLRPFECAGRMALTNYLTQTLLSTYVMYWYGLGLFGELSRVQQLQLVVEVYASQLAVSTLWFSVFAIGPVEWVWRGLTYLRPQPWLRQQEAAEPARLNADRV